MKKLIVLVFICTTSIVAFGQESGALWFTDFDMAKKTAKKEGKTILMYFTGSDWCAPCKMLKQDFWENDKFLAQADDFVLLEVDIPFRIDIVSEEQLVANKKLQAQYNKEKSFPTLLALNSKGKVIDEISAYSQLRDPGMYFAFLDKVR